MGLTENLEAHYSAILIASSSEPHQKTLSALNSLQLEVRQNSDHLSKFDQERLANNIQKLKEQIWGRKKVGRFQFKSKPIMSPKQPSTSLNGTFADSVSPVAVRSVQILDHNLQSSINLSNLTNSLVVYSQISGPAYLENVSESRIIVNSHQCRLKNCHNVEIWLERCLHPIIEHSHGITFVIPLSGRKMLVNDFSWMQDGESSPNYIIINSRDRPDWKPSKELTEEDVAQLAETARKIHSEY